MLAIAKKCVYVYTPGRVYVLAFDDVASVQVYEHVDAMLVWIETDKARLYINKRMVEAIIYSKGGN